MDETKPPDLSEKCRTNSARIGQPDHQGPRRSARNQANDEKNELETNTTATSEAAFLSDESETSDDDFLGYDINTIRANQSNTKGKSLSIKPTCCGNCSEFVLQTENHLKCEKCNNLFHLDCTSFNREVFSVMQTNNCFDDILWRCTKCKSGPKCELPVPGINNHLMKLLSSLQERITSLESQLKHLPSKTQPAHTLPPNRR